MSIDSLELQLVTAVQRFSSLQRRAATARDAAPLLARTLNELAAALDQGRVAQETLIEQRTQLTELQEQLRLQTERYWQLFDEFPDAYVVTRPDSTILEVNRVASDLLNVSQRFLAGKTLSVFICEDRSGFLSRVADLVAERSHAHLALKVRPRERAPLTVNAVAKADESEVRWHLRPDAVESMLRAGAM